MPTISIETEERIKKLIRDHAELQEKYIAVQKEYLFSMSNLREALEEITKLQAIMVAANEVWQHPEDEEAMGNLNKAFLEY